MRQCRWLELIKDYDCTISYHPGKANEVADALSRKYVDASVSEVEVQHQICMDLERLSLEVVEGKHQAVLASLVVQSTLQESICVVQKEDPELVKVMEGIQKGLRSDFGISGDGILRFRGRVCVLNDAGIRRVILKEAFTSHY